MITYPWPVPPGFSCAPRWTGLDYVIGDTSVPILSWEVGTSGWTDGLTSFHEETAGDNHFIDLASRGHALGQVTKYASVNPGVLLEIGCSSGFMLRLLGEQLPNWLIMGSDYVRGPLEQLANNLPGVPLLHFDLLSCPLPSNTLDAVVLLNVLEHIEDDASAVRQIHRILKPGGIAVIEVPAGPELYDVYDELLMHRRRYSARGLRDLLSQAGLTILNQSHLGFYMYPAFWLIKQRNKRFLAKAEAVKQKVVAQNIRNTGGNSLLRTLTHVELSLGHWLSYPFGIRCLATCSKTS